MAIVFIRGVLVTDDIVTRLREHALEGIWDFTKCSWDIQEASDEIERLRAEVKVWKHIAINAYRYGFNYFDKAEEKAQLDFEEDFSEAMRHG